MATFADDLLQYESPSQWGSIDIIRHILEADNNIRTLLDIIQSRNRRAAEADGKPSFKLADVLRVLGDHFVTMGSWEDDEIRSLTSAQDSPGDLMSTLGKMFFRMAGGPSCFNFRLPQDKLAAAFAAREPRNGKQFEDILAKCGKRCRKTLKEIRATLGKRLEPLDDDGTDYPPYKANDTLVKFLENEVELQRDHFKDRHADARKIGEQVGGHIATAKKIGLFKPGDTPSRLIERLSGQLHAKQLYLLETAWHEIERIQDPLILKLLLILGAVTDDTASQRRWARLILEDASLWDDFRGGGAKTMRKP